MPKSKVFTPGEGGGGGGFFTARADPGNVKGGGGKQDGT